jgi:hypothetical protein
MSGSWSQQSFGAKNPFVYTQGGEDSQQHARRRPGGDGSVAPMKRTEPAEKIEAAPFTAKPGLWKLWSGEPESPSFGPASAPAGVDSASTDVLSGAAREDLQDYTPEEIATRELEGLRFGDEPREDR